MEEQSTLNQRTYLIDLYRKLNWPLDGLKDTTKSEASQLIKKAKQALSECPTQDRAIYRNRDTENALGNDCARW